jgi:hypothetical protein
MPGVPSRLVRSSAGTSDWKIAPPWRAPRRSVSSEKQSCHMTDFFETKKKQFLCFVGPLNFYVGFPQQV